jgi:hypothetical protein
MCAHCRRELAGLRLINGAFSCGSAKCLAQAHFEGAPIVNAAASAAPAPVAPFESNNGAAVPQWHAQRMHEPNGG